MVSEANQEAGNSKWLSSDMDNHSHLQVIVTSALSPFEFSHN